MHFTPNEIYHVYNRRNDKQTIFFNDGNFIFFLNKIRKEWKPYCEILCYCLMPNHFHFMVVPNEDVCINIYLGDKLTHLQNFSKIIGKTLSSYTKAINIQNGTTGNLFQKKTKSKCLNDSESNSNKHSVYDYSLICFVYIHQNPFQANLVKELNQWKYSSFPAYYGYRKGTLCNKRLGMELLALSDLDLRKQEHLILDPKLILKIF